MSSNFLTQLRHRSIYYFRRRIPLDLQHHFAHSILKKTLNTASKKQAIILARGFASQLDRIFEHIRSMKKKNENDLIGISYGLEIHFNEYEQPTIKVTDAKDEDTEAIMAVVTAAIKANKNNIASTQPTSNVLPEAHYRPFNEYIDTYFQKADLKGTSRATLRSRLTHAQTYFGIETDPTSLTQMSVVDYADHVKSTIANPTTQGNYIQVVVTFINWHRIRKGLNSLTTSTLIPARQKPKHEDREAYSLEEMQVIFRNAFKYRRQEPHKWWVTVGVAFLGCRIEELCQVNIKTDLKHDRDQDVWYFNFNEDPESDGSQKKSLKKLASWRSVPIHGALVKYGFIDYLKSQLAKGASRPFELSWAARVVEEDGIHKWSHYITKWAGRELTKLSEDNQVVKGKKTYFHSMRHTFARLMQDAGVAGEISEALAGRNAGIGEQERYGKIKNNYALLYKEGIERGLKPLEDMLESVINQK